MPGLGKQLSFSVVFLTTFCLVEVGPSNKSTVEGKLTSALIEPWISMDHDPTDWNQRGLGEVTIQTLSDPSDPTFKSHATDFSRHNGDGLIRSRRTEQPTIAAI